MGQPPPQKKPQPKYESIKHQMDRQTDNWFGTKKEKQFSAIWLI